VGTATEGVLCGGARLEPDDDRPWVLLPSTRKRGTTCGATRLVEALQQAAGYVAERHPGLRLALGNVARCGGGDLPWSVSHNTGRDADLYFYMQADDGRQHLPEKVTPIDLRQLAVQDDTGRYAFALDANLDLVLQLCRATKVDVQWIFVANPIRRALLDRARERKVPARDLERLSVTLHQPRGALPHDDHFHVRVRCSEAERRTGCLDVPRPAGAEPPGADDEAVRALAQRVQKGPGREQALDLLRVLGARGVLGGVLDAWPHLDEAGRLSVLALAARDATDAKAHARLAKLVDRETSPRVVRHAIDLAFRRLDQPGGLDRVVDWSRRTRPLETPGDAFYTFRPDCVVVETAATAGSLALLKRLLATKERPCADHPDTWDHTLRWLTGFPAEAFLRLRPALLKLSPADLRTRALRDRGYLPGPSPSAADLMAAASSTEDDVAYNACRLLLAKLGRDPAACVADAPARLDLLRKALRK
jgi:penicillin-insensitive murein endopeptidase